MVLTFSRVDTNQLVLDHLATLPRIISAGSHSSQHGPCPGWLPKSLSFQSLESCWPWLHIITQVITHQNWSCCKQFIPLSTDVPYSDQEQRECGLKIAAAQCIQQPLRDFALKWFSYPWFQSTFLTQINPYRSPGGGVLFILSCALVLGDMKHVSCCELTLLCLIENSSLLSALYIYHFLFPCQFSPFSTAGAGEWSVRSTTVTMLSEDTVCSREYIH